MKNGDSNIRKAPAAAWFAVVVLASLLASREGSAAETRDLRVAVVPQFNGCALVFDSAVTTNRAGQKLSLTRADFLLSGFALHTADGRWLAQSNSVAYLNFRESRTDFVLKHLPAQAFDRLRFHIGLAPELNHSNPAQYPADHPLNPNLNGLHWGWAGGYIFAALEGHWQKASGETGGFSYHLGNDALLTTVEMSVALASQDGSLGLLLNLDQLFDFPLAEDAATTHSRAGDDVALRLQKNLALSLTALITPASGFMSDGLLATHDVRQPALIGTPYHFTFPAVFPVPRLPRDNPLTEEGVTLGRRLFSETQLSINNSQSCASCHQAGVAFSDPDKRFSVGAEGGIGTRNAMPLFNLAWKRSFFWDGRAGSLREQALMPIQNPIEMHETLPQVVAKLARTPEYPALFAAAFGSGVITSDRLARALEQFMLTLLAHDSKFDRAMAGQESLTEQEQRGFALFVTEYDPRRGFFGADCFHCHGGPFFTNHGFSNNGLEVTAADPGLAAVTHNAADRGKFAVPSLRNIELTAPYMHDGRFQTLEQTIEHYRSGIKRSTTLDPNIAKHPDGGVPLSDADKSALIAFLKTLTDNNLKQDLKNNTQPRLTSRR